MTSNETTQASAYKTGEYAITGVVAEQAEEGATGQEA